MQCGLATSLNDATTEYLIIGFVSFLTDYMDSTAAAFLSSDFIDTCDSSNALAGYSPGFA